MIPKNRLVNDVKTVLYRNDRHDDLTDIEGMDDVDVQKLDEMIDRLLCAAVDKIHSMAPSHMLTDSTLSVSGSSASIAWDDSADEYASVAIAPDSMLRLLAVRLPGWKRVVTQMVSFDDALYDTCRSEFAGIRPTRTFPAVALGLDAATGRVRIEAYPKASGGGTAQVGYVRRFDASGDITHDGVNVSERLYWSIVYTVCQLFYVSMRDDNSATLMEKEAIQMLNLNPEEK